MKNIKLEKLRLDGKTQSRVKVNTKAVSEYAQALDTGAVFPPIIVFFDSVDYWISDGIHRWHAAKKVGIDKMRCDVRDGTVEDAQWFSYSVNQDHGQRRTAGDKEKAVKGALLHPNGAKMSDRQIAEYVGVSDVTVAKYRRELEATSKLLKSDTRTGKDGRTTNTANIGSTQSDTDEPPEDEPEIIEVYEDEEPPEGYEFEEEDPEDEPKPEPEDIPPWGLLNNEAEAFCQASGYRERIADFLDTLAGEIRRDGPVAAARIENLAVKLRNA